MRKTTRIAGGAGFLLIITLAICAPGVSSQTMLGQLGDEKLRVVMEEYNRALGVGCAHCHVPDRWAEESKPQFATARNMNRMVAEVNFLPGGWHLPGLGASHLCGGSPECCKNCQVRGC